MQNLEFKIDQTDLKFYKVLRKRVNTYFKQQELNKTSNKKARLKVGVLLFLYLFFSVALFFANSFVELISVYGILGMLTIFLALNLAHDAAHGTFFKQKKHNKILLNIFDLLGASGYIWKSKHIYSHHPYVNISDVDQELKQSSIVRIFPNSQYHWYHKYQAWYMPIIYLLYTFFWLCFRDFKDFKEITKNKNLKNDIIIKEGIKLLMGKIFFFTRMLILPFFFTLHPFELIFLAFLTFHFVASTTVVLVLVSTHVGQFSHFPLPNKMGLMPYSWVKHQLITTCDFATENKLITQLFGSFNHHTVHHLFPNICHIHYPELTKVLKQTCLEFNMPYFSNPTLTTALKSHFNFLKIRSRQLIKVDPLEM